MKAAQALGPGEELTISYGDKCNMELLAHYGFLLDGNPVSTCEWDSALAKRLAATPSAPAHNTTSRPQNASQRVLEAHAGTL